MLSYFGCDQSQVQRYLSGSSLTQSRLSLLFNAFLKVPMQFLILLTGRAGVRLLPLPAAAAAVELGGAARSSSGAPPPAELGGAAGALRDARMPRGGRPRSVRRARGSDARRRRSARYLAARRARRRGAQRGRALSSAHRRRALQRHQLHLPVATSLAHLPARPRRPGDRRDLRGRDVHAVRRVQLARHRDHGRLLQALRAHRRRATRTTCWSRACSPRSGAASPA